MQKKNVISGVLFILLGVIVIPASLSLGLESTTSDGVPGAGFFPFVMSVGIILLGLLTIVQAVFKLKKEKDLVREKYPRENYLKSAMIFLMILVYIVLWHIVGYYIATFVIAVSANLFFKRSLKFTFMFSSILTLLIYLIFTVGLRIQFAV